MSARREHHLKQRLQIWEEEARLGARGSKRRAKAERTVAAIREELGDREPDARLDEMVDAAWEVLHPDDPVGPSEHMRGKYGSILVASGALDLLNENEHLREVMKEQA